MTQAQGPETDEVWPSQQWSNAVTGPGTREGAGCWTAGDLPGKGLMERARLCVFCDFQGEHFDV